MEENIKSLKTLIEENKYKRIIDVLNNENHMSFGDLLKREVYLKTGSKNEVETLKKLLIDKNIKFNRNTLDNWFYFEPPKKSDETREHMYKIAFALELNVEETKRLFERVYKDRPFNVRRINEFIYYVCLNNKYKYEDALEMIKEATEFNSTVNLLNDIKQLETKEEVLDYIQHNYYSFYMNNISANRVVKSLLDDIIVKEEEKELIKNKKINEQNSIIAQELCKRPDLYKKNYSLKSISGMLNIIYGMDIFSGSNHNFQDINLPKEVITNMPTKHTFSKKDPSYEELRKMIILLGSYKFWIINELNEMEYVLDDYIFEINGYLSDAHLSELYHSNQFDLFFLWCTSQQNPIKTFREILKNKY